MEVADRIQLSISMALRISLLFAIFFASLESRWLVVFVSSVTFILTFLPALIEHNLKVYLPLEFELVIILFIYSTLYLGEVHSYYTRFWWWDMVLHGGSALVFGFMGFLIIYTLRSEPRVSLQLSAGLAAIFSFAFAVSIGAVWEIFEFAMDSFFGLNMQKSGLVDTMWDLIVDTAGALIASIAGYIYMKKGTSPIFGHLVRKFVKNNPQFFGKH